MMANIIVPILEGVVILLVDFKQLYSNETVSKTLRLMNILTTDLVGLLQIFSGYILVTSVLTIRAFYKKKKHYGNLDIKMLTFHSIAFGLYLLADLAYYTIW
jgi:hypothetical protein